MRYQLVFVFKIYAGLMLPATLVVSHETTLSLQAMTLRTFHYTMALDREMQCCPIAYLGSSICGALA
jgi:hypothetical protein